MKIPAVKVHNTLWVKYKVYKTLCIKYKVYMTFDVKVIINRRASSGLVLHGTDISQEHQYHFRKVLNIFNWHFTDFV